MPKDQHLTDEQTVATFLHRVEARQAMERREKRSAAFCAAKASVRLEGFTLTEDDEAYVQQYIAGTITFDQLRVALVG